MRLFNVFEGPESRVSLINILEGIIDAVRSEVPGASLDDLEFISDYAENGCETPIDELTAAKLRRVGKNWLREIEYGKGEWSRMRQEAELALANTQD